MLKVEGIHTYYGTSYILQDVSLTVNEGEVVCVLGRNGVGKTTTIRSIIGLTPPREGNVYYKNQKINGLQPFHINRLGIAYVPEDRQVFPELTVYENLFIAQRSNNGDNNAEWTIEKVFELFPELGRIDKRLAGKLSGGEQQMLTIARALVGNPELILLDEPSEGLAPKVVLNLLEALKVIKKSTSILLAEQNAVFALNLADRGYILEKGRTVYEADAETIRSDKELQKKYLII